MEKYVLLDKEVGETPLSAAERFRAARPDLVGVPLAYAGRLDPMASGKLLVLIGEECKQQSDYHDLDKEYEFSVLFGIESDTHDVLGRLTCATDIPDISLEQLTAVANGLVGELSFSYPLFSAKTVKGKPLHMWTLENRLDEIEIPLRTSTIFELSVLESQQLPRQEIAATALQKINTIPEVTDPRKALGNDFRRKEVRIDWQELATDFCLPATYLVAQFRCITSSGAYMRTLATLIAKECGTAGLAWHIHRTKIGRYNAEKQAWEKLY